MRIVFLMPGGCRRWCFSSAFQHVSQCVFVRKKSPKPQTVTVLNMFVSGHHWS